MSVERFHTRAVVQSVATTHPLFFLPLHTFVVPPRYSKGTTERSQVLAATITLSI